MGKQSLWGAIKELIGHTAWCVFLWSISMTDEQYLKAINPELSDMQEEWKTNHE